MRAPILLALSFSAVTLLAPAGLRAQDPTDSLPVVESQDSSADEARDWPDSVDQPERVRRHRGEGNPYLREVGREGSDEHSVGHPSSRRRGSLWIGGSLGAGGEAIAAPAAPGPYNRSRLAPTLSFGIGGTVGEQLRIGLEGFVWFNPMGDNTLETVTAGMVTGRVYPIRTSGLFLKSGFGLGRYGQDVMDNCGCDGAIVSDYGFAWLVGAGFEAPVTRGLWIGPTVEMLRMNVTGPDGYRERVINVGISITFDGKN
jgi:hypothetical protein